MPTGTGYNPQKTSDFEKSKLIFSGQTIYFDALENDTTDGDLTLADDVLITGGQLLVKGGNIHDQVFMQVVHPTAGVLNEFVSGWRINPDSTDQFTIVLNYPAKIPAGLIIRCKYIADATTGTRDVAVNLHLHKVLE